MPWRTREGSTGRLLQLCLGYFVFYVITGVSVKFFLGSALEGLPGMSGIQYLVYSTVGGNGVALGVVLALGWYHMKSVRRVRWGRLDFPAEFLYIVPSGVCTAVVIPTTTLMYTLPISVMVAMVIMRGSIIVVSRAVDAIQIRQGILTKKVYREENWAVVFALLAVAAKVLWTPATLGGLARVLGPVGHTLFGGAAASAVGNGSFEFLRSRAAMAILSSYVGAYAIRLYIMNYYKNTRGKGAVQDNKAFFGVEQISASITMVLVAVLLFHAPSLFGWQPSQILQFREAVSHPAPQWGWGILAGTAFGIVAFFSVFLFLFKGRTATFAGLVNRLTSLVAGTTATLVFHFAFGGRLPSTEDWISLLFILIAVGFLSLAERRRIVELLVAHELEPLPATPAEAGALP